MDIRFTARKFKVHKQIHDHAVAVVKRLEKFYDGILRADIILSYERRVASVKSVEINVHVQGGILAASEASDDFYKSLDLAVAKLERQLAKWKTKERTKDKKTLRGVKEAVTPSEEEEE